MHAFMHGPLLLLPSVATGLAIDRYLVPLDRCMPAPALLDRSTSRWGPRRGPIEAARMDGPGDAPMPSPPTPAGPGRPARRRRLLHAPMPGGTATTRLYRVDVFWCRAHNRVKVSTT